VVLKHGTVQNERSGVFFKVFPCSTAVDSGENESEWVKHVSVAKMYTVMNALRPHVGLLTARDYSIIFCILTAP
jgi:hypothetical protein